MIDDNIYSVCGYGKEGPLNEFITINIRDKTYANALVD
jgi:hypothetical protein